MLESFTKRIIAVDKEGEKLDAFFNLQKIASIAQSVICLEEIL